MAFRENTFGIGSGHHRNLEFLHKSGEAGKTLWILERLAAAVSEEDEWVTGLEESIECGLRALRVARCGNGAVNGGRDRKLALINGRGRRGCAHHIRLHSGNVIGQADVHRLIRQ